MPINNKLIAGPVIALQTNSSSIPILIGFFRKKDSNSRPCSEADRIGWALTDTGQKVPVFRSHTSRKWLTYEEFQTEKRELRLAEEKYNCLVFTSRRGFTPALPLEGALAWKMVGNPEHHHRVQYMYIEGAWVRYSRGSGTDRWV